MPLPLIARALLGLLLPVLAVAPSWAESGLVTGAAAVADRSNAARAAAMPALLADALRRLTPDADPAASSRLHQLLAGRETELWLQRFEYQQRIRPTASGVPSIRLMLHGWFHAAPLRELLLDAGLPVWRGGRAEVTFWLVADPGLAAGLASGSALPADAPPTFEAGDDGRIAVDVGNEAAQTDAGRVLLDAGRVDTADLVQALAAQGVASRWAMNDLDDWRMIRELAPPTLADELAAAALRSAAAVPVLVHLQGGAPQVGARWHLLQGGAVTGFDSTGADIASALAAGAGELVQRLAHSQAVTAAETPDLAAAFDHGPGEYSIWLSGLSRAGSFANALAVLSAQSPVLSVAPEQASGDRVRVRVQLDQPLGRLLALLAVDGRLRLDADALAGGDAVSEPATAAGFGGPDRGPASGSTAVTDGDLGAGIGDGVDMAAVAGLDDGPGDGFGEAPGIDNGAGDPGSPDRTGNTAQPGELVLRWHE